MNKTLKKTLSIILAILMIAATMPIAFANDLSASGTCGDNVTYTYNSETGELVISGTGAMTDYSHSGSPFYESAIKTVVIKDGVTSIGDYAFQYCESLTSITIPDSVTTIGGNAFFVCTSVESVTIGNGVTSIGERAFAFCSSLESVTIPDSVTSIGVHAFFMCTSVESVTIPDSVTSIGDHAFFMCTSVESVIFGNSVTSIGERAFDCGTSLKSVTISSGEPSMYEDMLDVHESSIELLVVPCSWITTVLRFDVDPENIFCIHDANEDFYGACGDSCESLGLPHYINPETGICEFCVSDSGSCKGGTSWTLYRDGTLTISGEGSIDRNAFFANGDIKRVFIGDKVTSIGDNAFYNCTGITNITLGDGITSIGNKAFYNCTSLASVKIPNNLTNIGKYAFDNCSDLTVVSVPCTQNTEAPLYSFDSSVNVTVRDHIYKDGECAVCGVPCSHSFENDTCTFCGIIIGTCGDNLTWTLCSDGTLTIIGEGAIDDLAFLGRTDIKNVIIGDEITSIGDSAFFYCTSLESVTILDSVTTIGLGAFELCSSLANITIPDSVTSIGNAAFYGCTSLTAVCYLGTGEKWDEITIGPDNTFLTAAEIHYCIKTENAIDATCTEDGKTAVLYCSDCNEYFDGEKIEALIHDIVIDEAVEPTCTETGLKEGSHCSHCTDATVEQEEIPALDHIDADGDYICDNGCDYEFEKPVDPTPDTPDDPADTDCDHICHSDNGIVSFLWKIVNFLQKLFGVQQDCDCGIAHW